MNPSQERWARHPTYPQIHASSHGRIWREAIINGRGHRLQGKYLSESLYKDNKYLRVGFHHEGRLRTLPVHRLVYVAFHGPIPPHLEIDHIDHNKTNNHLSNLQLLTPKENLRKRRCTKLSQEKADEIRRRVAETDVKKIRLASEYGVTPCTISAILANRIWKPEVLSTPRGAAR